ncbi:hypothetical protein, partial [Acinetobacter oleivorans]|uniref:hypothetical protein n=1 Tax=Acinetobacter oleivorans TaxID=1148157 RepID=UPI0012501A68
MIYSPFENNDQINSYHQRCNKFFETFPESKILRRESIDIDSGAESLLASLKKLTGVTPEQEELWESNKQKLRSGKLPIPFFMRGQFLQNTGDVYTTWMKSKCCEDEELEFKMIHSSQIEENIFSNLIENTDIILIEETSLLILDE